GLEHGPFESRAFQQLADPGVGPPLPSELDGQVDRAEVPAARRAVGPDIAAFRQAAATPGAGVLARAVLREGFVAVEEAEGVVPGDVLVGVGLPRGLVHGRLARLQDLAEVVSKQVPAEEVVVLAVGAVDNDTLDAARGKHRLQRVDIDEVLLKSFPLLGVDLLRVTVEVVGGVDVFFVGHLTYPTLRSLLSGPQRGAPEHSPQEVS